jgi:hypothetical protein
MKSKLALVSVIATFVLVVSVTGIHSQTYQQTELRELVITLEYPETGSAIKYGDKITTLVKTTDKSGNPVNTEMKITAIPMVIPQFAFEFEGLQQNKGLTFAQVESKDRPLGEYSIKVEASKPGFKPAEKTLEDAFNLGHAPELSNFGVDKNFGSWKESYEFTVVFTDLDHETNEISLWKSKDGKKEMIDTKQESGVSHVVEFTANFDKGDKGLLKIWVSAKDPNGFTDKEGLVMVLY